VVISRLRSKFPHIAPQRLETIVWEEHQALRGHPVRDFVAVLVEHAARQRLRALDTPNENVVS